jgi:hypothetical protein
MLTLAVVSRSHAVTTEFIVDFTATGFNPTSSFVPDISGEFAATFDPAADSSGTPVIIKFAGMRYTSSPVLESFNYVAGSGSLRVTFQVILADLSLWDKPYPPNGSITLWTYGYDQWPPVVGFESTTASMTYGLFTTTTGTASLVPLPSGLLLCCAGLLSLAGVGLRQRRARS